MALQHPKHLPKRSHASEAEAKSTAAFIEDKRLVRLRVYA